VGPGRTADQPIDPEPAPQTTRQLLLQWLSEREYGFDELRESMGLGPRDLENELRHVQRSLGHGGGRLEITPAACRSCGFEFIGRESRHLHPPSRCPKCRSERIDEPRFRVTGRT
jgi:predicted Zn-ribbon and HTH transcriptional regulator